MILVLNEQRGGFPFVKTRGFPNCPPATSQIGNSLFKTSVMNIEHCSPDEPLEFLFSYYVLFGNNLSIP